MAAGLYRVNTLVTLVPGAFTENLYAASGLPVNGTGSNANAANNWGSGAGTPVAPANPGQFGSVGPQGHVVKAGQLVWVDPAAALGVALGGAGNLTAITTPGQETGGFYGTAN